MGNKITFLNECDIVFRKFRKVKKFDVISVGDTIKFNGGKAYIVKSLEKDRSSCENKKVYLKPYSGYHPVLFPGEIPYEDRVWESIRHLNYEMEQKMDSIYSVSKAEQSEKPDFHSLSVDEAHKKAIECNEHRINDI
ncbi:hypothetical protein GLW20_01795 [Virgibacillus halodenitrificans]|nr:hypothetical protein [Virgibacillus halodenitrificans]